MMSELDLDHLQALASELGGIIDGESALALIAEVRRLGRLRTRDAKSYQGLLDTCNRHCRTINQNHGEVFDALHADEFEESINFLPNEVRAMRAERDKLRAQVQELEDKLSGYGLANAECNLLRARVQELETEVKANFRNSLHNAGTAIGLSAENTKLRQALGSIVRTLEVGADSVTVLSVRWASSLDIARAALAASPEPGE